MRNLVGDGIGPKVAVAAVTAVVGFLSGWSAGGVAQGLGLAAALGTAGGVAAFSERPGGRWACGTWSRRRRKPGSTA